MDSSRSQQEVAHDSVTVVTVSHFDSVNGLVRVTAGGDSMTAGQDKLDGWPGDHARSHSALLHNKKGSNNSFRNKNNLVNVL